MQVTPRAGTVVPGRASRHMYELPGPCGVCRWKIWQIFDPAARVDSITETAWHLRAEVVAEEEEGLDQPGALHVNCLQISREGGQVRADGEASKGKAGLGRGLAGHVQLAGSVGLALADSGAVEESCCFRMPK